jgi:drug/metabolite transporter (DMT)-like permease
MITVSTSTQTLPILINLIAAVFGATGQLLYKRGSALLTKVPFYANLPLIGGCLCFCGVMSLFVLSYRLGGKVSVAYPFYATAFIWSAVIARFVLEEPMSPVQWIGVLAVTLGVAAIAGGQITA